MRVAALPPAAALFATLFLATGQARAQQFGEEAKDYSMSSPRYYVHPAYPGTIYRHASTPQEGFARGAAALILARAEYNLRTAQAWLVAAEARRAEIDNRRMAIETAFHNREVNRMSRAAERGPRPSTEDLARLAADARPDRPDPDRLDPRTGEMDWPALLLASEFTQYRLAMEELFLRRDGQGNVDPAGTREIVRTANTMLDLLKRQISEVAPTQYMSAKRFLESLAYEAKLSDG